MKIIYAGPSLSKINIKKCIEKKSNFILKGPIKAGDLWNHIATFNNITDVLIIDGYFYSKLAVLHSEILEAISLGIRVHGSASLGALRAVELTANGMIGYGEIYNFYSLNPQTGDDEVAVLHSPQKPYECHTIPLINIRILHNKLKQSIYKDNISIVISELEKIAFSKRNWQQIKKICIDNISDSRGLEVFNQIKHDYIDYKHRDAIRSINFLIKKGQTSTIHTSSRISPDKNKLKNQYIDICINNTDDKLLTIDQFTSLLRLSGAFSQSSFALEHFKDIIYSRYHDSFQITNQELEDEIQRINTKFNQLLMQDSKTRTLYNIESADWAKVNLVFERYIKEKIDENEIYYVNYLLFRSITTSDFSVEPNIDLEHLLNLKKVLNIIIPTKNQLHDVNLLKTFSTIAKIKVSQFWSKALITRFNDYKKILSSLLTK